MQFDFDDPIDRRNTHCAKWDALENLYGVSPDDGLAMWVADMDFRAPPCVNKALAEAVEHGVHGYFSDESDYKQAIISWMQRRHGWQVEPEWISTAHGLVSGVGLCLQAFTDPGDLVILFTPVYHAFAKITKANKRVIHEAPLALADGRYEMDLDALAASLTPKDKVVILCSPHNPGGRVWEPSELRALADFCVKHDLLLISDEIHHDLLMPGNKHTVMQNAAPDIEDRLVMLTAASKTFNLAGGMTGNVIIPDPKLRAKFTTVLLATGASPNRFGIAMTTAAYDEGEAWLDALLTYLDENRKIFDEGMNAIPGVHSMPMQSTYLSWVDFSGTGMALKDVIERVQGKAKVVGNHGPTFGTGGETYLRFNIATRRSLVEEAVKRLKSAFSDLQ